MARLFVLASVLLAAVACNADSGRIVGGNPTTIEYYTSLVQVEFQGVFTGTWSQFCAASILNSRNVLSAAHCFSGLLYEPTLRRIRAGATYRNTGGDLVYVLQEIIHPSFGENALDGDITVVRLSDPLTYSPVVQQAIIVAQGYSVPDDLAVDVAGWGLTSEDGEPSDQLHDVTLYTINNEVCREKYAELPNHFVTENMICAGIPDVGGKDACEGDAGGAVYINNIVIGVISWGNGCASESYPRVSTAVSSYTDWIVAAVEG